MRREKESIEVESRVEMIFNMDQMRRQMTAAGDKVREAGAVPLTGQLSHVCWHFLAPIGRRYQSLIVVCFFIDKRKTRNRS